jgi:UDP-N-acetylmuramate--alanine ligase
MFASFADYETEFDELIQNMPPDGLVVYNADDAELVKLAHKSNISQASFGFDDAANFKIENVQYGRDYSTIEVLNNYSKNVSSHLMGLTEDYKIQLPGKINVYNALAVIATLRTLGFSQEQIALELLSYQGLKRRFEVLGEKNGVTIIDDYAHHPTAVRETLSAAKLKYAGSKIWAVFEPHTFSRTKATLDDLVKSFGAADEVLISEIYPAREKASAATITSQEVIDKINNKKVRLVHNKQEALDILKSELKPGDVVVVMAVGDFNRLGYELKQIL